MEKGYVSLYVFVLPSPPPSRGRVPIIETTIRWEN